MRPNVRVYSREEALALNDFATLEKHGFSEQIADVFSTCLKKR